MRGFAAAGGGPKKKGPPSLQPGKRAKQAESVRQVIRSLGSRSRSKSSDQRRSETTGHRGRRIPGRGPSSSWQEAGGSWQRGILGRRPMTPRTGPISEKGHQADRTGQARSPLDQVGLGSVPSTALCCVLQPAVVDNSDKPLGPNPKPCRRIGCWPLLCATVVLLRGMVANISLVCPGQLG